MRHRVAVRLLTALALVAVSLAWSLPARADVEGFDVKINKTPGTFVAGGDPLSLTAEVSTDRDGRCRKVRWALDVKTDGISLDQLRISRVENDKPFQVRAQVNDDTAQLVDLQLDPGELCRDKKVSARWDIAFAGPDDGKVDFRVRAFDSTGVEFDTAESSGRVLSPVSATPSETPSEKESPSPTPTDDSTEEPVASDNPPAGRNSGDGSGDRSGGAEAVGDINRTSGTPSVLGPGIIIGAVLVFLGVSLLMRIRSRNRKAAMAEAPTGFYTMPRRR